MLLDNFDAWYKHPQYTTVQKQSYAGAKMPWALASDEQFFPDDLDYSDEYTEKWKGWYDDWKPQTHGTGEKGVTEWRSNDKQVRVWNPDPDMIDAGWEQTDEADWSKAYGDGETTGWGTTGDMAGEVYDEVNDPGYGDWGQQQGDPDYKIDKTDPNWRYNWAQEDTTGDGIDGIPDWGFALDQHFNESSWGDNDQQPMGGTTSGQPPQSGMVWSDLVGGWVFPDEPAEDVEPVEEVEPVEDVEV